MDDKLSFLFQILPGTSIALLVEVFFFFLSGVEGHKNYNSTSVAMIFSFV